MNYLVHSIIPAIMGIWLGWVFKTKLAWVYSNNPQQWRLILRWRPHLTSVTLLVDKKTSEFIVIAGMKRVITFHWRKKK